MMMRLDWIVSHVHFGMCLDVWLRAFGAHFGAGNQISKIWLTSMQNFADRTRSNLNANVTDAWR